MEKRKKDSQISKIRRILVKQLIDGEYKGNQSDFARAVNKKPQHIYALIKSGRNIGNHVARDIETALNKPQGWLSNKNNIKDEYLDILDAQERFLEGFDEYNENEPKNHTGIPLLTVSNVIQFIHSKGSIETIEYIQSSMAHSRHAFALLMPDESLNDASFRKGDILVVEPDIYPESGDMILVSLDKKVIIGQLFVNLNNQYLQNNNEKIAMPEMTQTIGVVIEQQRQLLNHTVLEQRLTTR